jgi:hypothetical protein
MFVNSIPVDVVGGAYDIAANYLKGTGLIPPEVDFHQPLFDSIVRDVQAGNRNRLRLANRAIVRIEKATCLGIDSVRLRKKPMVR